jgi:uncharacterized membrane protein
MSQRVIRYFGAAMAAVAAGMYFLIAGRVVTVLDDAPRDQTIFGLIAGFGFALGVVLLLVSQRRVVWILGAALQVFVIAMYFNVAPNRTPHYEEFGLLLRIPQLLILLSLAYLALRAPRRGGRPAGYAALSM